MAALRMSFGLFAQQRVEIHESPLNDLLREFDYFSSTAIGPDFLSQGAELVKIDGSLAFVRGVHDHFGEVGGILLTFSRGSRRGEHRAILVRQRGFEKRNPITYASIFHPESAGQRFFNVSAVRIRNKI